MEDMQKEIDAKMEKRARVVDENGNLEGDINDILEENKLIESEIDKLG